MVQINRIFVFFVVAIFLFNVGAYLYKLSLQGGDVDWIHKNMFYLTYTLLLSLFFFIAGFMYLITSTTVPRRWRVGLAVYGLVLLIALFLYDYDNTVERHGGYNQLVFLVLFFPVFLLCLSILACAKFLPRRKLIALWIAIIFTLTATSAIRLARAHLVWERGLGTARMEPATPTNKLACDIIPARYIWEDLLPNRALNFWTGSQSCPATPSFAAFSRGGVDGRKLTVNCPAPNGADILLLPSPLGVAPENKSAEGPLQQFTLSAARRLSLPPGQHTVDVDDAEAALVTCPGGPGNAPGNGHDNLVFQCLRSATAVARVTSASSTTDVAPSTAIGRKPNVLIVYMDALSRRQFLRKFPMATAMLNEMIATGRAPVPAASVSTSTSSTAAGPAEVEVFQFFRYHSLSSHTRNNLKALFTGATIGEKDGRRLGADALRPVWREFHENGYVTAVIDNSCQDWAAKYYRLPSTGLDHHIVTPFCLPEYYPPGNPHGNWVGPFAIRRRCLAGRHVHKYVWDYLGKFWQAYRDVPKFAFAAWTEGHEGTGEVIGMLDPQIPEFFRSKIVDFRDTIVLFLSDHGLHMGLWWGLQTRNSRLENALPLAIAVVPKSFLDARPQYRENLKHNEQVLFSAFDVHTTLHRLAGAPPAANRAASFAYSLLEDRIPKERTCDDANIPDDRCQCGLKQNRN